MVPGNQTDSVSGNFPKAIVFLIWLSFSKLASNSNLNCFNFLALARISFSSSFWLAASNSWIESELNGSIVKISCWRFKTIFLAFSGRLRFPVSTRAMSPLEIPSKPENWIWDRPRCTLRFLRLCTLLAVFYFSKNYQRFCKWKYCKCFFCLQYFRLQRIRNDKLNLNLSKRKFFINPQDVSFFIFSLNHLSTT